VQELLQAGPILFILQISQHLQLVTFYIRCRPCSRNPKRTCRK